MVDQLISNATKDILEEEKYKLDQTSEEIEAASDTEVEDDTEVDDKNLMQDYLDGLKDLRKGYIVNASVISSDQEFVYVDVSYKTEGKLRREEVKGDVNPGDTFKVMVMKLSDSDGNVIVSKRKAEVLVKWDELKTAKESQTPVNGTVVKEIKGGLEVDLGFGIRGFLPSSLADIKQKTPLKNHLGQKYSFKVIDFNRRRENIVLSRRAFLEEEKTTALEAFYKDIEEDRTVFEGVVRSIMEYGAFVSLGHIDGLLHRNDISYGHVGKVSDFLKKGETVKVKVISFDKEKNKIALSMKALKEDPWLTIDNKFKVGDTAKGKVAKVVDFGAFVDLEEGITGMVHVSDMLYSSKRCDPKKIVTLGDEVDVKILELNKEKRKLSLGFKQLKPEPWGDFIKKYKANEVVEGVVVSFTNFGAFIAIEDGVEGLLHISDMAWLGKVKHPKDVLDLGQVVKVKILKIDEEKKKLSLGYKQTLENPWIHIESNYPAGSVVKGKIKNITDFGVFVEIEEGVEGLLRIGDISWTEKVEKLEDKYKMDDIIEVMVVDIDADKQKIGLGIKQMSEDPLKIFGKKYKIGDVITGKVAKSTDFGVFLELGNDIEGLVHKSEINFKKNPSVEDFPKVGETVKAKIIALNFKGRKVRLSVKKAEEALEKKLIKDLESNAEQGWDSSIGANFPELKKLLEAKEAKKQ